MGETGKIGGGNQRCPHTDLNWTRAKRYRDDEEGNCYMKDADDTVFIRPQIVFRRQVAKFCTDKIGFAL